MSGNDTSIKKEESLDSDQYRVARLTAAGPSRNFTGVPCLHPWQDAKRATKYCWSWSKRYNHALPHPHSERLTVPKWIRHPSPDEQMTEKRSGGKCYRTNTHLDRSQFRPKSIGTEARLDRRPGPSNNSAMRIAMPRCGPGQRRHGQEEEKETLDVTGKSSASVSSGIGGIDYVQPSCGCMQSQRDAQETTKN